MYQSMRKMQDVPETAAVGSMWTVTEEQQLMESLSGNKSIDDIAKEHKRTKGGIKSRIRFLAANMIGNGKSIEDVCAMFRLAKDEVEHIQEKFAAKKEKTEHKKKEQTTKETEIDETHLDVLKDIRTILLRMEEKFDKLSL
jgi:Ca2+-dependent lipid-binding protein